METRFEIRLGLVWLVLVLLTLGSFLVARSGSHGEPGPDAAIASGMILVSLFKVRLILMEFMEVRHSPALLSRLTDAWLLFTAAVLLGAYWTGLAFN